MKNKNRIWIYPIIALGLTVLLTNSCKKDDISPISNNPTNGKTTAVFNNGLTYGTMSDQDGNVYKTITIGSQTWMAENLRTTKYREGSTIPEVTEMETWDNIIDGAYCNYNNTKGADTISTYGRLYNWYAVSDSRNLAPSGWHIASHNEWLQLTDYLGGLGEAGGKLKETVTTHWKAPNEKATNESGFTALPGGHRHPNGNFSYIGSNGFWWCATVGVTNDAWSRIISYNTSDILDLKYEKEWGFYVRCVKD